ncbi:hypothetical protein [Actinokineospora inagensis]|uniref:hypothetical protein n=1 Tax=Actinokineospora inagensis TaxID=103730 RepID=UPI000408AB5F|nr:hypothetical protein [Actinokineospora inagensis]
MITASRRRHVLVAVGAVGELGPLRDIAHVFERDPRVAVRWTATNGAPNVDTALRERGLDPVPWHRACGAPSDLVLARHTTGEIDGFVLTVTDAHDIPIAVGIPDPTAQLAAEAAIPGATGRTFVMGDPVLDRALALRGRRAEFRALLGVPDGVVLVAIADRRGDVATAVLSRLPYDEFRVVSLHPGAEPEPPGLITIGTESDLPAVLVAADVVVGDSAKHTPGKPVVRRVEGDILARVRAAVSTADAAPTGSPGLLQDKLYALLDLEPRQPPLPRPFDVLRTVAHPPTVFNVSTVEDSGAVVVHRFPYVPGRRSGEDILVLVDTDAADPVLRANAEIIVADGDLAKVRQTLRETHCALAAAATGTRAWFAWYSGETWVVDGATVPLTALAAATYHHVVEDEPITKPVELVVRVGAHRGTFRVRPAG